MKVKNGRPTEKTVPDNRKRGQDHGTGISPPAVAAPGTIAAHGAGDPSAAGRLHLSPVRRPGKRVRQEVASMPGVFRLSVDLVVEEAKAARDAGVPAVLLFGLPQKTTPAARPANPGAVQRAMRQIKKKLPELLVITDVCLCGYTSHGHCGVVHDGRWTTTPLWSSWPRWPSPMPRPAPTSSPLRI